EEVPPRPSTAPPPGFSDLVRGAVRALNLPATLEKSGLIARLPRTLREVLRQSQADRSAEPTLQEESQALRLLLLQAIERLAVADRAGNAQVLQYQVLHMQYVLGMSVVQVAVRLSISEQTVYRRSAEGIEAVASDLWQREQLVAVRHRDPVALDYLG